jgi:hypothetical protein
MEEEKRRTHDVVVQKDIALATGESLSAYTQKVRDAGCKYVKQKLNLGDKCGCYPVEVFSKSVIFDVYNYSANVDDSTRYRYFAAAYTRKDTGEFEFSTLTEVERVISYQPKTTAVTKAAWSTATINDLPDAAFAVVLPGGKKDSGGKTVPRGLRMFPHHTASVKSGTENSTVDLPHLRNALARLDQADMPTAAKSTARAHLMKHAKELLPSDKSDAKTQKRELSDAPGWAVTEKSLWNGVL